MAIPKAKAAEPQKKKTFRDKLKGSALFLLLVIVFVTGAIVFGIAWISNLLSTGDFWW